MDLPVPAPGFDDPLGVLRACHDRIVRYARLLRAVADDRAPLADSAAQVYRYFSSAGVDHHQDEEQDLFPVLSSRGAGTIVAALVTEHRSLDQLWSVVFPVLTGARGHADRDWRKSAAQFAALNEAHVALENDALLPLAARILTPPEIQGLGAAMARRRGLVVLTPDVKTDR